MNSSKLHYDGPGKTTGGAIMSAPTNQAAVDAPTFQVFLNNGPACLEQGLSSWTWVGFDAQAAVDALAPRRLRSDAVERFESYLGSMPAPGNGCHPAILGAANLGTAAELPPADIARCIADAIPAGRRAVPDREITDAVKKAAKDSGRTFQPITMKQRAVRKRHEDTIARKLPELIQSAAGITEADILAASPVPIPDDPQDHTALFLKALYQPTDVLFIGNQYDKIVRPVSDWWDAFQRGLSTSQYVIPNPLTGQQAMTSAGKQSYRCDAAVAQYRFAVAEMDEMPREQQLQLWWGLNVSIHALTDSGGKSIHALISIPDVNNADEWTRKIEQGLFKEYLVPMGCDRACKNEARLSRLPGHFRENTRRWQRLLWLSPVAKAVQS